MAGEPGHKERHKQSHNFGFLAQHDPVFLELAASAERAFSHDPNTTLIKLRQFGEAVAQDIAARLNIQLEARTGQQELLYRIDGALGLDPTVRELFHTLRIEGNKATHQFRTQHREAMGGLKVARNLAVWFHRAFADSDFKAGAFKPPDDPSQELRDLQAEMSRLRSELASASEQAEAQRRLAELESREKTEYAELAEAMDAEARQLAKQSRDQQAELERREREFKQRLAEQQQAQADGDASQDGATQGPERARLRQANRALNEQLGMDEELTRLLIDQQLQEAGWEADTQLLSWKQGARPEPGKHCAIAEWELPSGERADYVLFHGLVPIAVVEAKRQNVDVAGKLGQAERYARGFNEQGLAQGASGQGSLEPAWRREGRTVAWPDDQEGHFGVPFVFSCNGRPYLPQLAEKSGIWFRDVRDPGNLARALPCFHSPDGLLDRLTRSRAVSERRLRDESFSYLGLRDYQQRAISAVEGALESGAQRALLAMATGTGKTHTIIGLIYRFLKAERFRRVLFLVDRQALGQQALDAFDEAQLEQNHTLSQIYNIAELGDMAAEAETRVQVATVQAMSRRLFMADEPPLVDTYDCLIIDEAHRGYTLDQEMTEGELETRDAGQYLSRYRRVIDHFDAVCIGLTATPAKHTSEIFGRPVFTYSYREAVADDWLIDHEPPIRYETLLSRHGIHFDKGEAVSRIDARTGEVESAELEDELDFGVEAFNRRVVAPEFNRVVCEQLSRELDPFGEEKALIFCANDLHADMVKRLLDEAFHARYGKSYRQAAVAKITGKADKVNDLIRRYKNDKYPNIAVTVDLLTTGIDVPSICHLIFMRRVKSRILYEQMIGRATRRCDDIGKTVFLIYDPVDLYASLAGVNTMQPLVKDPHITLEQLHAELTDPEQRARALEAPGQREGQSHADDVLDQLSQKLMRVMRQATKQAETRDDVRQTLQQLEEQWDVAPDKLHQHLHQLGPQAAAAFLDQHQGLLRQVAEVKARLSSSHMPVIYEGSDELVDRHQDYGVHEKPADYLESFDDFIKNQLNESVALGVVVNRPRDLTRETLKEVRLLLDSAGYSEAALESAWRNATNQEIAASIVGHIRRAALGEALVPFEQRVRDAMQSIFALHDWTPNQRKWLDRLAKQLTHEVVLDHQQINRSFSNHGGVKRLDAVLDHHLDEVLEALNDALWEAS
ncbi:type I restriction-modification system endonuclease [Halomonas halmophila]|uniref:Type I restriction-modification system deoxyribonuclease n=1 Tax=Halomonas halmophila TaxID=252 RepID=A0A4Y4F370_9GAMM|nr:type I restriction-modification system endonuclease [Halomonas halmophila]GED21588.1 type I restriction-modification system deoxyribonuclease [Halomonas halmophila]